MATLGDFYFLKKGNEVELALNSIDEILMFCLDVFRVGRRGPKFRFPIREGKKNYAA